MSGRSERKSNAAWQKGQSGNPKGRPPGSRNALSDAFIKALATDFQAHGVRTIAKVRRYKPDEYLKLIARVIPQKVELGGTIDVSVTERRAAIQRKLDSIAAAGGADRVLQ